MSTTSVSAQDHASVLPLDRLATEELTSYFHHSSAHLHDLVTKALPAINRAIEMTVAALSSEGKLFYLGAGTSGRLGALDASECPPTFGSDPSLFQAVIAGGKTALTATIEEVEDDPEQAVSDLKEHGLCDKDVVVGIAASGKTPYVIGGLAYANKIGASTIAVACVANPQLAEVAQHAICCAVGPEPLLGSTRLNAGTVQKWILNLLSTCTMIRLGKVYDHWMVSMKPSNAKLRARAIRIVSSITQASEDLAKQVLIKSNFDIKLAVLMAHHGCSLEESARLLEHASGNLRSALNMSLSDQH